MPLVSTKRAAILFISHYLGDWPSRVSILHSFWLHFRFLHRNIHRDTLYNPAGNLDCLAYRSTAVSGLVGLDNVGGRDCFDGWLLNNDLDPVSLRTDSRVFKVTHLIKPAPIWTALGRMRAVDCPSAISSDNHRDSDSDFLTHLFSPVRTSVMCGHAACRAEEFLQRSGHLRSRPTERDKLRWARFHARPTTCAPRWCYGFLDH